MDFKAILEGLKLSHAQLLAIAAVAGFLTLAPDYILLSIGLLDVRTNYRMWISLAFLISSALFLANIATSAYHSAYAKIRYSAAMRKLKQKLKYLSPQEQTILRSYIDQNTKTLYFSLQDGVVRGLESQQIIYRSSEIGDLYDEGFAFNLQPWAWEYLRRNPQVLRG